MYRYVSDDERELSCGHDLGFLKDLAKIAFLWNNIVIKKYGFPAVFFGKIHGPFKADERLPLKINGNIRSDLESILSVWKVVEERRVKCQNNIQSLKHELKEINEILKDTEEDNTVKSFINERKLSIIFEMKLELENYSYLFNKFL